MSETLPGTVWLTQAKYDELAHELDQLRSVGRADVVKKVSEARDEGDLKENGAYHAAREELGKIDGRIIFLAETLERAEVGETPPDDGVVEPGMELTVRFPELDQEKTFVLGSREMADDSVEVFSPQSPMGEAINGARQGQTVSYKAPNGKAIKVTILKAVPYDG